MGGERKIVAENLRRVLLKEYLMSQTSRAGFGGLDIQRTPMGTRITLLIERPGMVIGKKGSAIKFLTESVENRFKFDHPQIEVQEVGNPSLNAQIMAEKLASALERGWHFRRAGHSTVRRIMDSGAKGVLVTITGKLTGQRHRTQKFKEGHIKYCGEPSQIYMNKGYSVAKLKQGVIGVTVKIMDPKAKLPDEIEVRKASVEGPTEGPPLVVAVPGEIVEPLPELPVEDPDAPGAPVEKKERIVIDKTTIKVKKELKKTLKKARDVEVNLVVEGET